MSIFGRSESRLLANSEARKRRSAVDGCCIRTVDQNRQKHHLRDHRHSSPFQDVRRVRGCSHKPTCGHRQRTLLQNRYISRNSDMGTRVPARLKLVSQDRIIQNAFSRLCAFLRLGAPLTASSHGLTSSIAQHSVGRPKHVRVMAGGLEGDVFIGRRAQEYRGLLKIKYPMEHGIVTDWDDMERIWNWIYTEELGTLSEEVRTPKIENGIYSFCAASCASNGSAT